MIRWLAFLLLFLTAPAAAQLGTATAHMRNELVAEGPAVPGREVELAILMTPEEGWHGYWENPGDAGKPMTVAWELPAGASVGPLRYPVPTRLTVAGLMNYVFKGPYAVLVRLKVPANATGAIPVRADLDYLVCTDEVCVPERGSVALNLPVATGGARDPRFDQWRAKVPQPLGSGATYDVRGPTLRIAIPLPAAVDIGQPYLYPVTDDVVRYGEPQRFRRNGDMLVAELPIVRSPKGSFSGTVDLGSGRALRIEAAPGAVPDGGREVGSDTLRIALLALLGAIVGGLLLNLMPCVFPILALKALALARAGGDERHARLDALAYTAGAVAGTGALGGVLLALRAGGSAAGWAFQLQDSRTVAVLALLAVAITLNLLGLFKLPVIGGDARPRGGFATGALAAFVATPCAGPFMGAALGTALLLPTAGALLVFAGLGLGVGLPFLLLAYIPTLRRRLPKPGAWMQRLQRFLAIPMALSAAAAFWLLWRQGGPTALLIGLIAAALLGALLFAVGRRQNAGNIGWPLGLVGALTAVAAVMAMPTATPAAAHRLGEDEAWSEAKVAAARAQNRPVFVYFTADWCLSCKVNEASTIDRDSVREALKAANAEVLRADWTNADPAITRFLDSRGRAAIPLYLWYAPGAAEPEELPQVLTPAMLIDRARKRTG